VIKTYAWKCPLCKMCDICNIPGDDDKIILCDGCDRGFHTFCLRPPLEELPEGDWLCDTCSNLIAKSKKENLKKKKTHNKGKRNYETPTDSGNSAVGEDHGKIAKVEKKDTPELESGSKSESEADTKPPPTRGRGGRRPRGRPRKVVTTESQNNNRKKSHK